MRIACILFAALGLGCRDEASTDCRPGHADEHRERYANICRDAGLAGDGFATIGGPVTPEASLEGVRLGVSPFGLEVGEETTTNPADIERHVREEIERARSPNGNGEHPRFVLAIDRDAPMTVVDAVARALIGSGVLEGVLALAAAERSPPAVYPEIHRRLAAQIEGASPADRAMKLAAAIEPLVGDCAPLDKAISGVSALPPSERCAALTQPLADAFVSCGCPASEPVIMTLIQIATGVDAPYIHAHAVRLVLAPTAFERPEKHWGEFVAAHRDSLAQLEIPAESK